jgi:hypothetical protein
MNELNDWGIGKTNFREWYSRQMMFRMRAAIKNAKKNKKTFKQEFRTICDNPNIEEAHRILRANKYKDIPLKNIIQFFMIWNRDYYGVKLLWK